MTDQEGNFLLMDRIQKIQQIINKYGEENFYISFSGGKDSTVLSELIDMALPDNTIPRVFSNTGIEYRLILDFIEKIKQKPHKWELVILKPTKPIKQTLEDVGYPFKSKRHAKVVSIFQRLGRTESVIQYLKECDSPKFRSSMLTCPNILKYQFQDDFNLRISDKCCYELKEKPLENWKKQVHRSYHISGIMREEGGRRFNAVCLAFSRNKLKAFHPLAPLSKEWEEWFINKFNIDISDIYKEPYNFERTGCKGCPFALHLQKELDTLEKFFPAERKQCEFIWKPVYDEYRRLNYRLKAYNQLSFEDFMKEDNNGKET